MHFDLSDEQKQFEDGVERLLADAVDLIAMTKGADAIAAVRAKVDRELNRIGAPLVLVAEADGGLGMGLLTLAVLAERMGRHAAPGAAAHSALAAWAVAECGDGAVRDRWLDALTGGEVQAAFAFNEAPGVWAPDEWRARSSDAEVTKHNVVDAAQAQLLVVGLGDGMLFVEAASARIEPGTQDDLDMTRPTSTVSVDPGAGHFVAAGAGDAAARLSARCYDALLVLSAAGAAAAGRRAFEMAVDYAKQREQFDRVIGSFQGVKHQLADMAVDIEPARFLCWYAAHAWDQKLPDASRSAALAKSHAADVAVKTARASVEAHGGIGYTWDYPLHLLLKRAMHDRAAFGGSVALRRRVAALTPPPG